MPQMSGETVIDKTVSHRVVGKLREATEIIEEWKKNR